MSFDNQKQYLEGDIDASIRGTAIMWEDGSDTLTPVSVTKPLPISVGTALNGPGQPTIDSFTSVAISASANTADQSLISAPGVNKQIWIYGLFGSADVAGSISLQDEDNTAISGVMPVGATGGFVIPLSGNFAMPWKKVATNKAVEIDTVTCAFKGLIAYAIVSV